MNEDQKAHPEGCQLVVLYEGTKAPQSSTLYATSSSSWYVPPKRVKRLCAFVSRATRDMPPYEKARIRAMKKGKRRCIGSTGCGLQPGGIGGSAFLRGDRCDP